MTIEKTILVVDDELGYREMLQMDLSRQGFHVLTAGSGPEALQILDKAKVDLVVTDMKMPKMDGLMTTVEIRKKFPSLPIVLMTGYALEDTMKQALQFKATTSLRKPFNISDFNKAVHNVLPS